MKEDVILVDKNDNEIGSMEKIEAHKKGLLHRAFSIFVFNSRGELLMQKRAKNKYHSGGLWSNTCCGHPRAYEDINIAIRRRLNEEMGFDCKLNKVFSFKYFTKFNNEIIENELDHVFVGLYDGEININKNEAEDYKWMPIENLKKDILENPEIYSYWLKMIMSRFLRFIVNFKNTK